MLSLRYIASYHGHALQHNEGHACAEYVQNQKYEQNARNAICRVSPVHDRKHKQHTNKW